MNALKRVSTYMWEEMKKSYEKCDECWTINDNDNRMVISFFIVSAGDIYLFDANDSPQNRCVHV